MPWFGGIAKHLYRCEGRQFSGSFDDCFNDYLPILEFSLPFFCLLLLYPFARLSSSLFAPQPEQRTFRWRLASRSSGEDFYPTLHIFPAIGAAWAIWRGLSYPFVAQMWPYLLFWLVFALWFALGIVIAWPRKGQ